MGNTVFKFKAKARRHKRVRKKISGSSTRPRLTVFRSNLHISAQLVDDVSGKTLASASSLDKEIKQKKIKSGKIETATAVGQLLASRAKSAKIVQAVFDRSGYLYHGRVKALAEGAREGGLKF